MIATASKRLVPPAALLALALLGCGLMVLASKFWLIDRFGSNTPFWDQWDLAALTFEPFVTGTLDPASLLRAHNEHRILLTRLLGLLLLGANGLWSPVLEMMVNAMLHVVALGVLLWACAPAMRRPAQIGLLVFTTIIAMVPVGWENTLAGFQSQFYFVLLFGALSLRLLVQNPSFAPRWWLGAMCCVLAFFSLASGILAAAAASFAIAVRNIRAGASWRDWAAAGLLAAMFAAGYAATPVIPQHAVVRAQGGVQFFGATVLALGWPHVGLIMALLRNTPFIALSRELLHAKPERGDAAWVLFALAVWVTAQSLALAFGRAADVLAPRYQDLYVAAVVVNAAALVHALERVNWRRGLAPLAALAWGVFILYGLYGFAHDTQVIAQIRGNHQARLMQTENLAAYERTHDRETLMKLPFYQLPYPRPGELAAWMDRPAIRALLPGNLQAPLRPSEANLGGGFVSGGVPADVPPCGCEEWGTFGQAGPAATGVLRLRFAPAGPGLSRAAYAILVSGYPTAAGSIEVVQHGRSQALPIDRDPGPIWSAIMFSVDDGPFEVVVKDASAQAWVGVSTPTRIGRLDAWTDKTLAGWLRYALAGFALVLLAGALALRRHREMRAQA